LGFNWLSASCIHGFWLELNGAEKAPTPDSWKGAFAEASAGGTIGEGIVGSASVGWFSSPNYNNDGKGWVGFPPAGLSLDSGSSVSPNWSKSFFWAPNWGKS
jgi:hypothetical protein